MTLAQTVVPDTLPRGCGAGSGDWLGQAESGFTILAIIVGGVWAYYNFFKGRLYRTRLEPSISGRYLRRNGGAWLIATVRLRNAGVAKAEITQEGSGVRLSVSDASVPVPVPGKAEWRLGATFSVLQNHRWIESGETVSEEHLIEVEDQEDPAFLLEMRIISLKVAFRTQCVVVDGDHAPATGG
jgi:hypothetical protein